MTRKHHRSGKSLRRELSEFLRRRAVVGPEDLFKQQSKAFGRLESELRSGGEGGETDLGLLSDTAVEHSTRLMEMAERIEKKGLLTLSEQALLVGKEKELWEKVRDHTLR